MANTNHIDVNSTEYTQIAAETEDFMFQNPTNGVMHVVYAATQPEATARGFTVAPFKLWGRQDAASVTINQGIVWVRTTAPVTTRLPINK